MSTTEPAIATAAPSTDAHLQYRALSMSAVSALALTILSLPALFFPALLVLAFVAALVGLFAWIRTSRRREELVGLPLARAAFVVSTLIFVSGTAWSSYEYATEVPEGYRRIGWQELQPESINAPVPIPQSAILLDGKKVFIKGYVHPAVDRRRGIKHFVLVPDMKTCCFGGQPKLTDMIEVALIGSDTIDFSFTKRKLAGTLRVSPYKKSISGLDGVYYQLEADYVQ